MKRGYLGLAVLAGGLVALTASLSMSADKAPAAPAAGAASGCCGTKLAVVDLVRVFNEFKQTRALNQKMAEHREKLSAEKDKRQTEINALREQLDGFAPDSAEYHERSKQLTSKRIELEVWQNVKLDEISGDHLRWIKRTYQMVTDQVAAVAKARGVELVLTREELDTPNTSDTTKQMQATLQQILNRKVVYSDPGLDITDEVLKKLDAEFEKRGGEKGLDPTK